MKKFLLITLSTLSIFCFQKSVFAQAESEYFNPDLDIDEMLPPLDSLMILGLKSNPNQKYEQEQTNSNYWTMQYTKIMWTQGLRLFFNYTTGDQNIDFRNSGIGPGVGVNQLQITNGWRAGFDVQLSMFDLFGSSMRNKSAKAQWESAKHKKNVEAMAYRQAVADLYTNMVGWQRVFKARNEDLWLQKTACDVAEKEFREGNIQINEFARQKNILAVASSAKEDAQRNYFNYYQRLQALIGVPLTTLKR